MKKTKAAEASELRPTTLRLPADLIRAARLHAVQTDTTLQALVADALSAYLKARRPKEK